MDETMGEKKTAKRGGSDFPLVVAVVVESVYLSFREDLPKTSKMRKNKDVLKRASERR